MKIIGEAGDNNLVCIISIDEICNVFNHYSSYSTGAEHLVNSLSVGKEVDLGTGHDFKREIADVCNKTIEAFKSFEKAQKTLLAFSELVVKGQSVSDDKQ